MYQYYYTWYTNKQESVESGILIIFYVQPQSQRGVIHEHWQIDSSYVVFTERNASVLRPQLLARVDSWNSKFSLLSKYRPRLIFIVTLEQNIPVTLL